VTGPNDECLSSPIPTPGFLTGPHAQNFFCTPIRTRRARGQDRQERITGHVPAVVEQGDRLGKTLIDDCGDRN
jgi:hypothetical protein